MSDMKDEIRQLLKAEAQSLLAAKEKAASEREEKKKNWNPNITARNIINRFNIFFYGDSFFIYSKGRYVIQTDNQMREIIHEELGDEYRQSKFKEVQDCMIAQCLATTINDTSGLNVLNGVLDLDTMVLRDHSHSERFTNQIQTEFIPDSTAPKWIAFLNQVLGDEPAKIAILQEYAGYCLDHGINLETILFLLGRGANGKSVFANTIHSVMGEENCETMSLDDLRNKNYLADLLGKLVNIATESQGKAEVYESTLKRLASGEHIKVDRKFKNPFTFKSNCKHIYCLNNLPRIGDKTDAFFRRIIAVPFNIQIKREDQVLGLHRQLANEERSGILNWMLEGYLRLKRNGWQFTKSEQVEQLADEYRKDNNNVLSFVEEKCYLDEPEAFTSNEELYETYVEYCKKSGVQNVKKKSMLHELTENFNLKRGKLGGFRGLNGIRLGL